VTILDSDGAGLMICEGPSTFGLMVIIGFGFGFGFGAVGAMDETDDVQLWCCQQ